jgi:hypothetical protein
LVPGQPFRFHEPECTRTFPTLQHPKSADRLFSKRLSNTAQIINFNEPTRDKITHTILPDIGSGSSWHTHQPLNILYLSTPGTTYSRLASVTSCCSCNLSAYQICSVSEVESQHTLPSTPRRPLRNLLKEITPRQRRRTKRLRIQISLSLRLMDRLLPSGYVPILSR